MNVVEFGLLLLTVLLVVAVATPWLVPASQRSRVCGGLVGLLGLAGTATGVAAMAGGQAQVSVTASLPIAPLTVAPDPLGGFFMVVIGAVAAATAVYGVGYARSGAAGSATAWTALAALVYCLLMVPASADAVSFLLFWELMALTSTALVLVEHRTNAEVRSAGVWFAVMVHVSFLLLLGGFAVLTVEAGSTSFAAMSTVAPDSPAGLWAFGLLALGFAAKAGLVPLHVWVPRADPAAPSHVSALMSAAMVKLGVYGALLLVVRLLPGGPSWQGTGLMILGGVSAVFGVLQASVATDLKRLLAFSSTENVGLMFIAVGAASLLASRGASDVAGVAAVACLMLVAGHAPMKTAAFLAAGSVLHATGERDLDRMGGLGRTMPVTAACFGIAALGAAALPVTGGFVAEWALLQALIHGSVPGDQLVAVAMPVAVGVVALTTGIALMTFVKAYGIAFLARPRSLEAGHAHEVTPAMRLGMAAAAAAVLLTGLFPAVVAAAAARAVDAPVVGTSSAGGLLLVPFDVLVNPVALTVLALVLLSGVGVVGALAARRRPRRRVDLVWACGSEELTSRMEYTATSYAEPLTRVFDDVLLQTRDLEVTHAEESRYLVAKVQFSQQVADVFETRMFKPAIRLVDRVGALGGVLQNGSIHRYLLYSFIGLLVVLVVASR